MSQVLWGLSRCEIQLQLWKKACKSLQIHRRYCPTWQRKAWNGAFMPPCPTKTHQKYMQRRRTEGGTYGFQLDRRTSGALQARLIWVCPALVYVARPVELV